MGRKNVLSKRYILATAGGPFVPATSDRRPASRPGGASVLPTDRVNITARREQRREEGNLRPGHHRRHLRVHPHARRDHPRDRPGRDLRHPHHGGPEQMNPAKVVATYKSLARVERDFRSLKSIDLDLRPIQPLHRKPGPRPTCSSAPSPPTCSGTYAPPGRR